MPTPHPDPHHHPPTRRNGSHTPAAVAPYTRADAIADALLFEVPIRLSRLFGFTYPVAVTAQAWFDAVAWDLQAEAGKPLPTGETETWRITEVLAAARDAVAAGIPGLPTIPFTVYRIPPTGPVARLVRLTLQITIHSGDHGETVATISHRPSTVAGRFHLPETPHLHWPATGFDYDDNGVHPVVTADTLDLVLATATIGTLLCGVDATPGLNGDLHVHLWAGITTTLHPDQVGHYHLRHLGWPFTSEPNPE